MATVAKTLQPPVASVGIVGWLRKNLFSTWFNALLTLVALWVIYSVLSGVLGFVLNAQWTVITANLRLFMVGRYPVDQVWRPQASVSILALLIGANWAVWRGIFRTVAVA